MSHAWGEVIRNNEVVGFFEYNGTSDFVLTRIFRTKEDLSENWRKKNHAECTCGRPGDDVTLWTDYGGGYYWAGKACLSCMAVTDGIHPWDDGDPTDGHPLDKHRLRTETQT